MLRRKTYRYRLDPNPSQEAAIDRIAGCCRLVYNLGLEQMRLFGRSGRRIGYLSQASELVVLKREFPWLSEVPSHCLQQALKRLERAYRAFFDGRAGYPRPRIKGMHDSFTFPDPKQIRMDHGRKLLVLPKFGRTSKDSGPLKLRLHRPLRGNIKQVTLIRKAGHWYAAISVEIRGKAPMPIDAAPIGIDRGVVISAALSDGRMVHLPRLRRGEAQRLLRLQHKIARQKRGSANQEHTKESIARLHQRVANRRHDRIQKLSSDLAKNHGLIVLEKLNIRGMTRSATGSRAKPGQNVRQKAGLNRSILASGWGGLERQLAYKARWYGSKVVFVPAHHTSQTCPDCGVIDTESRQSQARFRCVACGYEANADLTAAKEILRRGIALQTGAGLALAACGDLGISRSMKQEFKDLELVR